MVAAGSARLCSLEIDDFGLIHHARVEFASGLTAFSGETGSGKTMLLGALAFALGARASSDQLRTGASRALVSVELDPGDTLGSILAKDGFPLDPGQLATISREMTVAGKNAARINARPATAAQLRAFAELIVDFVGQHEAQRLLTPSYHLEILDRFAGEATVAKRQLIGELHAERALLQSELAQLEAEDERARRELVEAREAVREIDDARLLHGEDEELRSRRSFLTNAERIAEVLGIAHERLCEGERSALDVTGDAAVALAKVAQVDPRLQEIYERALALEGEIAELGAALVRELERTEFDAAELEAIGERLDRIERLRRRYGASLERVIAARDGFAEAIERHETRDERAGALRKRLDDVVGRLEHAMRELSAQRREAAKSFEARVAAELGGVAMGSSRFTIEIEPVELGPRGAERIEFQLAPAPSEPARPLARIASGGELSRVLLAIAVVLADRRERTALIFDEIDAGIGGATAAAVGERLALLARSAQVICVTHLAQIASWADAHYSLRRIERGRTVEIGVASLDDRGAIESEIARMLSGGGAQVAIKHASELLRDAGARKRAKSSR